MKIHSYILLTLIVVVGVSCTAGSKLSRRQNNAGIAYVPRKFKAVEKDTTINQVIKIVKSDGSATFYAPAIIVNGEKMMSLQLPEVTVVAKSRTVAERMGYVNIDFVVTIPKELQGNCRSISLTPFLHKNGEIVPLQDLMIRGELFSRVQVRNYWQFDRYRSLFRPDSIAEKNAFERFVNYPYPVGVRLDSIVEHSETFSYFYTQKIKTDELSERLQITLGGGVVALDHSSYKLPLSDTLNYNISSMLNFLDTTTRYMTLIIEKYALVKDRNHLNFKVNETGIIDTLGNNREQLEKIEGLFNTLINQNEFHIDSIILTASASPEGTVKKNEQLAKGRALSLRDRLVKRFPGDRIDKLITVRWMGEDWTELIRLIEDSGEINNKSGILAIITAHSDRDFAEKEIKRIYPQDYKYMLENLYPMLRAVSFKYDLRRVGMIKDTIHTTVPDTVYARGVRLLDERKYSKALYVLDEYKDRNTAIAMLSLGYDESAYRILSALPESAIIAYLKAIACARLGRKDEGLEHYEKACSLEENLRYRGGLDPEITLLKEP